MFTVGFIKPKIPQFLFITEKKYCLYNHTN